MAASIARTSADGGKWLPESSRAVATGAGLEPLASAAATAASARDHSEEG